MLPAVRTAVSICQSSSQPDHTPDLEAIAHPTRPRVLCSELSAIPRREISARDANEPTDIQIAMSISWRSRRPRMLAAVVVGLVLAGTQGAGAEVQRVVVTVRQDVLGGRY